MSHRIVTFAAAMLCTVALAQTTNAAKVKAFDVAKAKEAVADEVTDPDSVRLRKLFIADFTGKDDKYRVHLCGEINAKNRMGGYVGYRRFFVSEDMKASIEKGVEPSMQTADGVSQEIFNMGYSIYCANKVKEIK